MGELYDQVCSWDNLRLAHQKAARGKRGKRAAAAFEYNLADNLLQLQDELVRKTYQPGPYDSFYIHDPKHRLISAAPFRDRVAHHALCNAIEPTFERSFVYDSRRRRPTARERGRIARWIGRKVLRADSSTCYNVTWNNSFLRLTTRSCARHWRARLATPMCCGS